MPTGRRAISTVGTEEPFDKAQLLALYANHDTYVQRFSRRLDELVAEGWLLPEDADTMRSEARSLAF